MQDWVVFNTGCDNDKVTRDYNLLKVPFDYVKSNFKRNCPSTTCCWILKVCTSRGKRCTTVCKYLVIITAISGWREDRCHHKCPEQQKFCPWLSSTDNPRQLLFNTSTNKACVFIIMTPRRVNESLFVIFGPLEVVMNEAIRSKT